MRCPSCDCLDDKVVDTRIAKEGDSIRRRRECLSCKHRFTTRESVIQTELVVVKRDGTREDFDPDKLRAGVQHACWKRAVGQAQIDGLVETVSTRLDKLLQREVASNTLGEMVMAELQKIDEVAFVRFASVYRSFKDVGQFINEVQNLTESQAMRNEENIV